MSVKPEKVLNELINALKIASYNMLGRVSRKSSRVIYEFEKGLKMSPRVLIRY